MTRGNQHRTDPAVKRAEQRRMLARIARILVTVLLFAGVVGGGWWLNRTLTVSEWTVTAPEPIKQAIESRLQAMNNRDFLHTRPAALREQWLIEIPDMEDVQIVRHLPHAMQITALARKPAALWQDEQNRLHLFDSRGNAYRLLGKDESPDLPLLRVREEQLPAMHRLLQALAGQQVHKLSDLSEIHAGSGDWKLYFSRGSAWILWQRDASGTIKSVALLLSQPRWRQGQWTVDTRIPSRWFIRPAGHGGII